MPVPQPARRGSESRRHRLRRHGERGQATPSVVAVASVVALVVALVAFFTGGSSDDVTVTPAAQDQPAASPPAPTPTPAPTTTTGEDGGPGGAKQQERGRGADGAAVDDAPPEVYVEVYNNSAVSGLAGSTAAELQDAGWQVVGVDNWHGDIPESTVYHPAGMGREAHQLARELGITRVRGAVEPMKFDRLTVILTAEAA